MKAHALALFTILVWSTTFVATKVLLAAGLTPLWILVIRFVLGFAALSCLRPHRLRLANPRDGRLLPRRALPAWPATSCWRTWRSPSRAPRPSAPSAPPLPSSAPSSPLRAGSAPPPRELRHRVRPGHGRHPARRHRQRWECLHGKRRGQPHRLRAGLYRLARVGRLLNPCQPHRRSRLRDPGRHQAHLRVGPFVHDAGRSLRRGVPRTEALGRTPSSLRTCSSWGFSPLPPASPPGTSP